MRADALTPVVPNLRFPEFRTAGDWHFEPLGRITTQISDRAGTKKCVPMSVTTGGGLVSQQEKFGRIIAGESYKNYIRLQKNDFAYNKSATKEFPQGYIARYSGTMDAAVPNSIFTCFRPDTAAVLPEYLDHLFHGNHHGRWLRTYITVGARAHGALSVSDDDLMSIPVPLPPAAVSRPEQRKIADCLDSLDDLIAAEARKLEALRKHKSGLMQQLFPQDGETVPRLRFPEFRNAREWEEREVGEVFEVTRGQVLAMPLVKQERTDDAPYPVYSSQTKNVGLAGYFSDYLYEDAITWTTDGANAGDVNYRPGKFYCTNVCGVLINDTGFANPCTAALINSVSRQHVSYVGNPKLMNGVMARIRVAFPSLPEQKRIAACLSSLNDVLATQSRKVEVLTAHTHGLLQQLFPNLDEQPR